ncbi:MAG: M12 family metallopeptidase [Chthoniobacterales bacterium]
MSSVCHHHATKAGNKTRRLQSIATAFALALVCDADAGTEPVFDLATVESLLAQPTNKDGDIQVDDMVFRRADLLEQQRRLLAARGTRSSVRINVTTWPAGRVPIAFDDSVSDLNRQRFVAACAEWSAVADVSFVEATASDANYIRVFTSDENNSAIGMSGGEQVLNMVSWSYKYIICHELGHALGLSHEQSRSDRDAYVTIHLENVQPGKEHNFAKYTTTNETPYDFDSVMHYGPYAFAIADEPTITVNAGHEEEAADMGQQNRLSTYDIESVAMLYGSEKGSHPLLSYLGYTLHDGDAVGGSGNGDGRLNPGEDIQMDFKMRNNTFATARGVQALSTQYDDLASFANTSATSDIAPHGEADLTFRFRVGKLTRVGAQVSFTVNIDSELGHFNRTVILVAESASKPPTVTPAEVRVTKVKRARNAVTGLLTFTGTDSYAVSYEVESRGHVNGKPWSPWKLVSRKNVQVGNNNYAVKFRVPAADLLQFRVNAKNKFGRKVSPVIVVQPRGHKP